MVEFYRIPITLDMIPRLRKKFKYNSRTGDLTRMASSVRFKAGSSACILLKQTGYLSVYFEGVRYQAHRIIWAIHYGVEPPVEIDHKNRIRGDNSIKNLRSATSSNNKGNSELRSCSTSGYKGVNFYKRTGRYRATFGGDIHLGYFDTAIEAALVYDAYAAKYFGEFAFLNFPKGRAA